MDNGAETRYIRINAIIYFLTHTPMNWKKAVGFGAILWGAMFIIVSAFIGFKIYTLSWVPIVTALISGAISFTMAGFLKLMSAKMALSYAAVWVAVGLALDALISMRFAPAIFADWTLWLGYGLAFLAPLLRVKKPAQA